MRMHVTLGLVVAVVAAVVGGNALDLSASGSTDMFGDGSDGSITFSADTQFNPPVDAVVNSGAAAGTTLTVSSASGVFQPGQRILIHQTRGAGAGAWEMNEVQSYALGNIATVQPLANTYTTSGASAAQVLVLPQYTNVTVDAGVTLSAKPWNGSTGGILAFLANGTVAVAGTISGNGKGFRGGSQVQGGSNAQAYAGEGAFGATVPQTAANGNGGGGGFYSQGESAQSPGGGGGNGTAGETGADEGTGIAGVGGGIAGTVDLGTVVFGGAGGGGNGLISNPAVPGTDGGYGGGIVLASGFTVAVTGSITANGDQADPVTNTEHASAGGGGAGGSILIRTQSATFGTSLIGATGGPRQATSRMTAAAGGDGRIRVEYCTSISGGYADPPASLAQISCDLEPTPTPPPSVGGIAELPDTAGSPPSNPYPLQSVFLLIAGTALLALFALTAGAWYARRRLPRWPSRRR